MKNTLLIIGLSLLAFGCRPAEGTLFSWGNTDVRYEQDEYPEALTQQAFRYSAWKGEKMFAQAVFYAVEDMKNVQLPVEDLVAD